MKKSNRLIDGIGEIIDQSLTKLQLRPGHEKKRLIPKDRKYCYIGDKNFGLEKINNWLKRRDTILTSL